MSFSNRNQTLWPVYITIGNLDVKTRRSQKRPETLRLGFIPIFQERSQYTNNNNQDLKAKICHMTLKTML